LSRTLAIGRLPTGTVFISNISPDFNPAGRATAAGREATSLDGAAAGLAAAVCANPLLPDNAARASHAAAVAVFRIMLIIAISFPVSVPAHPGKRRPALGTITILPARL
jgi:hypothetical protein